MTIAAIREKRAAKVGEMRNMIQKAEQEKRSLSADETARFDALKGEVTSLEADEQRAAFMQDMERRQSGEPVGDKGAAQLEQRVSLLRVLQSAMEGRSLTGAEAEFAAEAERRTGRKAQGVFVPASLFNETRAASTTATAPELIGTDHRADLYIEPFRNALLARRLGVRVLSGLHGNVSIPKYGTGLSVGWVAENTAVPESNMDMDSITLSPKHAGGVTELSRQLIQQASPDVPPTLVGDLRHGNYSNSVELARQFVTLTLRRHLLAWEQAIASKLLTEAGRRIYFAEHQVEGLLRGDSVNRAAFYSSGIRDGWMLPSEARRLENMPTVDGIDDKPR